MWLGKCKRIIYSITMSWFCVASVQAGGPGDCNSNGVEDIDEFVTFFTSFEEPGVAGASPIIVQAADGATLPNNSGQLRTTYAAGSISPGVELGFTAKWNDGQGTNTTGPSASGTDADRVGVTDVTPGAAYPHGSFGYSFEDCDGRVTLTVDAAPIGLQPLSVSLDLFVASVAWEAADILKITVSDGVNTVTLLDTTGVDIDTLAIEGAWRTLSADLSALSGSATLKVEVDTNDNDERITIDQVVFETLDCNTNGILDECDVDCNTNDLVDDCEVDGGTAADCNGNGVPDECDLDCNANGTPDDCDIAGGTASDCDTNGVPDECDPAEGDCNANGVPDVCDLIGTTSSVTIENITFTGFTAAGFSPTPAAGQLDSDLWSIGEWSDAPGTLAFGGTATSGDFARGAVANPTSTNVSSGGVYSFDVDGGAGVNATLGIQPAAVGDGNPVTLTLRLTNNTCSPLTGFDVAYSVWVRNNEGRSSSFNFLYSSDNVNYTAVPALNLTSGQAVDALGWVKNDRSATISGLYVPAGAFYYLRWVGQDVAGSGSRDEFGLDDVVLKNPTGTECLGATPTSQDCNSNGMPDECDTAGPTSEDCNLNGAPDECESLADCDASGTPDVCETFGDCNANGVPDVCDIAGVTSDDCNSNGTPDDCEAATDCNDNGTLDGCDIAGATSEDCNVNGTPDECEPANDCNANGTLDDCEIYCGDERGACVPDCNGNGVPDECELSEGSSLDCNASGVPDECELGGNDCNGNGVPDECEPDCNANGTADGCDTAPGGGSVDCDVNGVPDECELAGGDGNGNGILDLCENFSRTNAGLSFFFDTRDTTSAAPIHGGSLGNTQWDSPILPWTNEPNGGGRGDAQVVYVSPVTSSGSHVYTSCDSSSQSTFLYMDVEDLAGDGDIVSSVGLDMPLVKQSGILSLDATTGLAMTVYNAAADVGGGATTDAWGSIVPGTVDVNGVDGMKLSRAPTYPGPDGLGVGGTYRLAKLTFQGGPRGSLPTSVGVYHLKLNVNDGLVTRACDPSGPNGQTPELPDFGYVGGGPEAASVPGVSGANGSSEGTTSPTADLTVRVQAKGDMDGSASIDIADITKFVNAFHGYPMGTTNVARMWMADIDCNNVIDLADVTGFVGCFQGWFVP